jgi:hypothetical protein
VTLCGVVDSGCGAEWPEQPASATAANKPRTVQPFALSVGPGFE